MNARWSEEDVAAFEGWHERRLRVVFERAHPYGFPPDLEPEITRDALRMISRCEASGMHAAEAAALIWARALRHEFCYIERDAPKPDRRSLDLAECPSAPGVYALQCGEMVKIGMSTKSIIGRLASATTMNPFRLTLIAVHHDPGQERRLRDRIGRIVNGEWVRATADEVRGRFVEAGGAPCDRVIQRGPRPAC